MKPLIRTVLVLLCLGAAAPVAQAAGPSAFLGGGLFLDSPGRVCLIGNGAIRRAIQRQGYDDVYLNVQNGRYIQARATQGRWVYLLGVNACSGRVIERERLRPA